MNQNDVLSNSVKLLKNAECVLFLTSAGMSADSNIPTFRDKDGYWENFPPFKEKNLEAQDLASPWAFNNVLHHAWAFYEWRRRNAHENKPHEGYHIINRWMKDRFADSFIHTTNTDGYHLISGSPEDKVKEVHGSMWRLQCLGVCSFDFWDETSPTLCELNSETMTASRFPTCPRCRGTARPHILMFGDGEYVGHPEQDRNFQKFSQKQVNLVLLVGSSGAVPTNDYIAKYFMDGGASIININPDESSNSIVRTEHFLKMKSLEAFIALETELNAN
jgi:NAD-dependent SIR2 family protein deacetylase